MNTAAAKNLLNLLAGFGVPAPDLEISGLCLDSRRVAPGDAFVALRGLATHGLAHVQQAVERGASVVIWESEGSAAAPDCEIPHVAVPRLSLRIGEIAARFYGRPSQQLAVVGITGTDGKTSTAHLLAQALSALGEPCAYAGTLGTGRLGRLRPSLHTTADAIAVQQFLAESRDSGCKAVAMEVSSHALHQSRVAGVHFSAAVLTNLTRDHLDYHGSVEAYAAAKRPLFFECSPGAAILNRDDACGAQWLGELAGAHGSVTAYGIDGVVPEQHSYVIGRALELRSDGLSMQLDTRWGQAELRSRLLGRFNAYNLLATAAALLNLGHPLRRVVEALCQLNTVPGRIEGFRGPLAQPLVVVDYAHTPKALELVLSALRAHTRGRLHCVFGCGGDRDRGKRPLMGAIAARLADVLVITDDNPRSEAPAAIVADILAGIESAPAVLRVEHDRDRAIRDTVAGAGADDVVLVAGKGHEQMQIYGSEQRAFSDRLLAAQLVGCEVRA